MILYLAGPISSDMDGYKLKFDAAESYLSNWKGHTVLNPAVLPIGLKCYEDYMRICCAMQQAADAIVMLRGWKKSKGANTELKRSIMIGQKIYYGIESVPLCDETDGRR